MSRITRELLEGVGVLTPLFVVLFIVMVGAFRKSAQPVPYLKRVAKKYSIPPLDLR